MRNLVCYLGSTLRPHLNCLYHHHVVFVRRRQQAAVRDSWILRCKWR